MSFSSELKEKLAVVGAACEFCMGAELAGVFKFAGRTAREGILIATENKAVAGYICTAAAECLGVKLQYDYRETSRTYLFSIRDSLTIDNISASLMLSPPEDISGMRPFACCKAAYVRGAFLGGGSISDPAKSYHMEFDARTEADAKDLAAVLAELDVPVKITCRKGHYIVYIKEYEVIADVLGIIGAGGAAMEIYNISIEKEIRNNVNRQVNCENANMDKVADAYCRHLAAIEKIKAGIGLDKLPDTLREIAEVRLAYPDESLKELGARLEKPIGKSGVNHRLARLLEIADSLKERDS